MNYYLKPIIKISAAGIFLICITFSCKNNDGERLSSHSDSGILESIKNIFSSRSLTVPEYIEWIKEHKGETFDEQENEKIRLSVMYKPLALETALSTDLNSRNKKLDFAKMKEIKKDFHYVTIECSEKSISATEINSSKKDFLDRVKNSILLVKNTNDTISQPIIELFPSSILNQPNQLLILIPSNDSIDRIQLKIRGDAFKLKDLNIDLDKSRLENFPEIKL